MKPSASFAELELGAPREKRSQGVVSGIVFLALNGYDFEAPEENFVEMVYGVARSDIEKTDVAMFMRKWSRNVD